MQYNGLKMGNNADQSSLFTAENERARRKLKELLQTPDEIVEVFKCLIFSKDDNQSLFDGSTKEMVSSAKHANYFRILFLTFAPHKIAVYIWLRLYIWVCIKHGMSIPLEKRNSSY